MNVQEKHLTPKQIAELTSLHIETIRRFCRERKIAPIRVFGSRIRIPESTYKKFLESHTAKGNGQ